jgi:hypothetical protein
MRVAMILAGLCVAAVTGCGSDDDDGGGTGGTGGGGGSGGSGIAADKMLSDLTDDEAMQLCEDNKAALQAILDAACTIIGLGEADEASCTTARDDCAAGLAADGGNPVVDCTDPTVVDYGSCTATVGELQDCKDEVVTYSNSLDCSQAGNVPDAPACAQSLQDKCPDVLGTP